MAEGQLFTKAEKSLLIARIARGRSCLRWRAAEEEPIVDKLMSLLESTQQQFDLPSFRKEVEDRARKAEQVKARDLMLGHDDTAALAEGEQLAYERVLALLPGEGE